MEQRFAPRSAALDRGVIDAPKRRVVPVG